MALSALIADMTMLVEIPMNVRKSRTPFWGLPHSSLLNLPVADVAKVNAAWKKRKRRKRRVAMEDPRRIPGRTGSGRKAVRGTTVS